MKTLCRGTGQRIRAQCGILVLFGFVLTCVLAYRDARSGYELRVWNRTEFPIEIYLVNGTTIHLFDVWHSEVSRPYLLKRTDVGELVFAPRGTGRRISRIELPKEALHATRRPDGSLFVELYPADLRLSDGQEWGISSPMRVPPESPLLYIGGMGWLFTIAALCRRK